MARSDGTAPVSGSHWPADAKAVVVCLLVVIVGSCHAVFDQQAAAERSSRELAQLPPCPLQTTDYRMGGRVATKCYDATTGHAWGVVETGDERQPLLVLDTAGTEAIG